MKNIIHIITLLFFGFANIYADDDIMSELDSIAPKVDDYTYATFKATRIITGHSIENVKSDELEFRIAHRFGRVNSGASDFFGLDVSTIYLDLNYGLNDWLNIGIGRTPVDKTVNLYSKIALLKQSASNSPLAFSYFASANINTSSASGEPLDEDFYNRLSYINQLLIARKFDEDLSIQISPTIIHKNMVARIADDNNIYALGIGARYKISKRASINFEYFHLFNKGLIYNSQKVISPMSIGMDIETGGHVFQIMLTNSFHSIEKQYIAENTGDWTKGDIHLGFNISRVFSIFSD